MMNYYPNQRPKPQRQKTPNRGKFLLGTLAVAVLGILVIKTIEEGLGEKRITNHPKRRVFFSFHWKDAWQASQVRNIGATSHDEPVSNNSWEQIKRSGDSAIKNWIDSQMAICSCVIVLIGQETHSRKWVNYEIRKAFNDGKGILGIYIDGIKDREGRTSRRGNNPFDSIILTDRRPLSRIITTYDPSVGGWDSQSQYAYIARNLEAWVEQALQNRRQE